LSPEFTLFPHQSVNDLKPKTHPNQLTATMPARASGSKGPTARETAPKSIEKKVSRKPIKMIKEKFTAAREAAKAKNTKAPAAVQEISTTPRIN
jgi:hypothetical protein